MSQRVISIVLSEVLADALKKSAEAGDERTAYLLAAVAFRQLEINLPPPSADMADGGATGCLLAIVEGEQERFLERLAAKREADNKRNRDGGKPDSGTIRDGIGNDSGTIRNRHKPDSNPLPLPLPLPEQLPKRGVCGAQKRTRETRPQSVEDVRAYAEAQGLTVDAGRFMDYYTAQGWTLSNGRPLKDWRAALRNWGRRAEERNQARAAITTTGGGAASNGNGDF